MKIKLEKRLDNLYYADLLDLPGSPPIGVGPSRHEAIAHLFYQLVTSSWYKSVNIDSLEIIEDEPKQPLYAKIHLSCDCEVELRLTGEVNKEAFNRLLEFLKVTGELWGLRKEEG